MSANKSLVSIGVPIIIMGAPGLGTSIVSFKKNSFAFSNSPVLRGFSASLNISSAIKPPSTCIPLLKLNKPAGTIST